MTIRRLCTALTLLCASVLLSACYVSSTVAPASDGLDERLAGPWVGLDEKGKVAPGAFLHFVKAKEKKPPRMIAVSPEGVEIYELHTVRTGAKGAFAAKRILAESEDDADKMSEDYVLGLYEFRGNRFAFSILSTEKVAALVDAGKVKGIKGTGTFFDVKLTGSPEELAAFLRSPEAAKAGAEKMRAIARKLPPQR